MTNARPLPAPANTMSSGASPTWSVRTTRERDTAAASTSTTLTLSDRWFTTHASVRPAALVRVATATGSSPTGTSATAASPGAPPVTS